MKLSAAALFLLVVWQGSGVTLRAASGPEEARASSEAFLRGRAVYEANCAVCHGTGGDGNGMAARMFRVRPRDFRRGLFKFRSTPSGSLPMAGDLVRTITEGIRWTGMVGRPDLSEADRRAVVRYIETFSPRFTGERPSSSVAVPPAPPESPDLVAQGGRLYRDAECGKCHGDRGRGDGASAPGMKDDWGWPTRPTDLTWRPLKRGPTPEGSYLTIATGLSGTPMPPYGGSAGGEVGSGPLTKCRTPTPLRSRFRHSVESSGSRSVSLPSNPPISRRFSTFLPAHHSFSFFPSRRRF